MRVIAVPTRLRWALAFLACSIPLAFYETLSITGNLPWRSKSFLVLGWGIGTALVFIGVAACIVRGFRWSPTLLTVWGATWVLTSTSYAVRMQNYSVAFFTLFLALYWFFARTWIRTEMRRSFFDPRMAWYHGLPRPIPGLECEIADATSLQVGRLDEDGAFVFTPSEERARALEAWLNSKAGQTGLRFRFMEKYVDCSGFAVTRLPGGAGAGVQFSGMTPDGRKDLSDFVEGLRGGGHVR